MRGLGNMELVSSTFAAELNRTTPENRVERGKAGVEADKRNRAPQEEKRSRKVFVNPLFDPDPGIDRSILRPRAMSSTGTGGDHGGTDEDPTHPKVLTGGALVAAQRREIRGIGGHGSGSASNWHGAAREGMADPVENLDGEVDMDDDAFLELDPEEEETMATPMAPPSPWRLLARYVNQRRPNTKDLTDHFHAVWQIRAGLNIAPIRKNWYVITLQSQGDFDFVARGGPWIHRGNVLLVAPFIGNARPSESVLEAVPVWVRFYDVPWDKQTCAYGWRIGKLLGKVLAVDADDSGTMIREFLRVRIELPLNRRLQMQVSIGIKGSAHEPEKYELRYERVPHYCFWCGFIGHDDTECEKKRMGVPKREYDDRLRCSPLRKFEHRPTNIPAGAKPTSARGLDFSSGGMGSPNLGGAPMGRSSRRSMQMEQHIPERVDARDGFEYQERRGELVVDAALAGQIRAMHMRLNREIPESSNMHERGGRKQHKTAGRGPGRIPMPIPLACKPPVKMFGPLDLMHSPDMIPSMRGTDSLVVSYGPSDVVMSDAESVLGKRQALSDADHEEEHQGDTHVVDQDREEEGGKSKKGKVKRTEEAIELDMGAKGEVDMEATSPGAAGKLTGPFVAPRQEQ